MDCCCKEGYTGIMNQLELSMSNNELMLYERGYDYFSHEEIASNELCSVSYFKTNFIYKRSWRTRTISSNLHRNPIKYTQHVAVFSDKNNKYNDINVCMLNIQDFRTMINFLCRFSGQPEPFINPSTDGRKAGASNEQ